MASRLRKPETDTIPLSGGDTITVKRSLNAGEFRQLIKAATKPIRISAETGRPDRDTAIELDPTATGLAMVLAYLLDWTFTDWEGRVIPIRDQPEPVIRAALDSIDAASYMEVQAAIQAHDTAVRAFAEAEKKATGGGTTPGLTSPSAG